MNEHKFICINTNTAQEANFCTVDIYTRFTPSPQTLPQYHQVPILILCTQWETMAIWHPDMPPNQLSLRYHDINKK